MILSLTEFIAHFHPLLVHLPIGILLIGLLLIFLSERERYAALRPAISLIILCGAITATASCITGYLLSIQDDYDKKLVGWHQWMGITVAVMAWILYLKIKKPSVAINKMVITLGLFVLVMITGHLGGSLTHGSDYLTKPLTGERDSTNAAQIPALPDVQNAMVYSEVIRPILQTKCFSCHGANKQKGKLRMDDSTALLKGGKDGKVIESGNGIASELIKRLQLPVDNEDHMPPKEKPQPTESQIALLNWWINQGVPFNRKVKDLPQPENIKASLLALQKAPEIKIEFASLPAGKVEPADQRVITELKQKGIVVIPVSQSSNWLSVNFVTDSSIDAASFELLHSLKKQLIWLKLSSTNLSDAQLETVGMLTHLRRLSIDHTRISDKGLASLAGLTELQYINLVGTGVTTEGILQLKKVTSLQAIFIYQTKVAGYEWSVLHNAFPKAMIDTGGYTVPTFSTDTQEVKMKKEY